LSGTVEIEKQTAWLKQENARLDEIAKQRKERLRRVNEKLDEIDAKYDALRRKSGINSTPPTTTDEN
jgi:predicted nuclease with TOPRIM domain